MSFHPIINPIIIAILIVIASMVAGQIFKYILGVIFKRLFSKTKTTLDDKMLEIIRSNIITLSVIIGFYIGLKTVKQSLAVNELTYHQVLDYISIALFFILVMVIARLVSRLIGSTIEWYMDEVSVKTQSNITATVAPMTKKIINLVLFLIASMIVLDHFGVNIGSLLVSLGVGSLAIALAAQETVANMIAGFVILIDQPFRIGDRIKLPSGDEGDVFQIGLRSTRILNFDNNFVVIPNSELVKNRLINYSFPDNVMRVLVEVNVTYGMDIEKVRNIILKIVHRHPDLISDPPPRVFFNNFGDVGIQLRLIARTSHFDKKFELETDLREKIYKAFTQEKIEIAYLKRTVIS